MLKELRPAFMLLLLMTLLTGIAYPVAVTTLAQTLFPWQAKGSLVEKDGRTLGSVLIGQSFSGPAYFWSRPSATTPPYNAASSTGSNLAPSAKALAEATAARIQTVRAANPQSGGSVPGDLVTSSASGLDPHISPAAALWQIKRVAATRQAPYDAIHDLVHAHIQGPEWGILGEPHVNVLQLNMALDAAWPIR